MAFKELVNQHMAHKSEGSGEASTTSAGVSSAMQAHVLTNTAGNISAVDVAIASYVACINGSSSGKALCANLLVPVHNYGFICL
jgi:hypothetical protein